MRALARKFREDEERWGIIGLLHDVDWEETMEKPELHGVRCQEILRDAGADEEMISVIVSHVYGHGSFADKARTEKTEHALAAAETITGLIFASALVHPEKKLSSVVQVKSIKKKMKDKSFAAKVNRDVIRECEKIGISVDEFIELSLGAMQGIADKIGL